MPVRLKGNYMTAARISYGVQSRDNFNLGFSLGYGNTLDTMGYRLRDPEPRLMRLAGVDLTMLRDNLEHRFDLYAGRWLDQDTLAVSYRFGINLDQEGRFKIEVAADLLEIRRGVRLRGGPLSFEPCHGGSDCPPGVHLRPQPG